MRENVNPARIDPATIGAANIGQAVENRHADLATLTIGQLTLEYGREFRTPADIAVGKGELIERLLLKFQHELEGQHG